VPRRCWRSSRGGFLCSKARSSRRRIRSIFFSDACLDRFRAVSRSRSSRCRHRFPRVFVRAVAAPAGHARGAGVDRRERRHRSRASGFIRR
jgi:hypothetical protein